MRRLSTAVVRRAARRLVMTYEERNAALKKSHAYPLVQSYRQVVPVADICRTSDSVVHTPAREAKGREVNIRGRVLGVRSAGKNLWFVDLEERGARIQVVVNKSAGGDTTEMPLVRRGDAIGATGIIWRTKAGELSLLGSVTLLSPCLHPLPEPSASSTVRQHNRVAELKAFKEARNVIEARSEVLASIQSFLRHQGFTQVQTPIISSQRGGASAEPFKMSEEQLWLRVAPELWLKRLVIGGMDRVYEVGPSFRNEGVDATHNPEFTTCEFYMAFASLEDLMDITKALITSVARTVAQRFPEYAPNADILLGHWHTLDFVPALEEATGLSLNMSDIRDYCTKVGCEFEPGDKDDKLLDRLSAMFLEPQCTEPTFIINHPSCLAPLAKQENALSRRFELLIRGREYVNAYEEENDPEAQLIKLQAQNSEVPDKSYVEAMEWGLPPTGGWGLGVDRLVMLLTGSDRIGQVLSFGTLTNVNRQ